MSGAPSNPIAADYIRALMLMTPRERALSHALLDLKSSALTVDGLLDLLQDENGPWFDPNTAPIVREVIRILREAGASAHAVQEAVIADALEVTVH